MSSILSFITMVSKLAEKAPVPMATGGRGLHQLWDPKPIARPREDSHSLNPKPCKEVWTTLYICRGNNPHLANAFQRLHVIFSSS